MTKKSNRIMNIISLMLVVAFAAIAAQPAGASPGAVSMTDGGDNIPFYGETLEFTWNSTVFADNPTFITIVNISARGSGNTSFFPPDPVTNPSNGTTQIVNDNGSAVSVVNVPVTAFGGSGNPSDPWKFRYFFRNDTIPVAPGGSLTTAGLVAVYVNGTENMNASNTVRPANFTVFINPWNLSLETNGTNRAALGSSVGTSTLKGDRIQVSLKTFGLVSRDGIAPNLTIDEPGATISGPNLDSPNTGNFTWNITTATPGLVRNITLNIGTSHFGFTRNSTFIMENMMFRALGLTKGSNSGQNKQALQYNVSELNLTVFTLRSGVNNQSFVSINITSLASDGITKVVNQTIPYAVNITLSTDFAEFVQFNNTINRVTANPHAATNILFLEIFNAGVNTSIGVENGWQTNPLRANVSSVTTTLPVVKTLIAQVNTSLTNFTKSFSIQNPADKLTILTPAAGSTFTVGENITISGWNATLGGQVYVNITGPDGVIPANSQVWNLTAPVSGIDGTWSVTWVTNETWNNQSATIPRAGGITSGTGNNSNISFAPTGTYTIAINENPNSTAGGGDPLGTANTTWRATRTVTIAENFTATQSRTTMGPDDTLFINTTSDRRLANGTIVVLNLTVGNKVVNNTQRGVVTDSKFNARTNISVTNISWNPFWGLAALHSTGLEGLGSPITVSIRVNDTAVANTAMTVTITDSIAVTTTVASTGKPNVITGTSSRANGTPIFINITGLNHGNALTCGASIGSPCNPSFTSAFVYGGQWNKTWNATIDGLAGGTALGQGDYTVTVNDTIVKLNSTITLGAATITVSAPSTANIDDIVTINGTTNLAPGSRIVFNITTSGNKILNLSSIGVSGYTLPNATVASNGTYSIVWRVNESQYLLNNFTGPSSTYTINASEANGSTKAVTTIALTDSLTVNTSRPVVVPADTFNISGTTRRTPGTRINITVAGSNINQLTNTTVLANGDFQATVAATTNLIAGGASLSAGTYTVFVNDTLNLAPLVELANATTSFTVGTATIGITSPAAGQTFGNTTNITLSGTSNRGAGAAVTLTITQATGGTYTNTTIPATTIANGNWLAAWNTAGIHAGGATVTPGSYTIIAQTGGVAAAVSVTITAALAPVLTTINVTPATATVVSGATQQFNASGLDQNGAAIAISPAVFWSSSNTNVGTINSSTGLFTANKVGTTTITAKNGSAGTVSGTATVNVTAGALSTITVTPATTTVQVLGTQQFTAAGADAAGNDVPITANWTSSNVTVGTINAAGMFTAAAVGTTTVMAVNGTVNGTAAVTVALVVPTLTVTAAPTTVTVGVPTSVTFTVTSAATPVANATVTLTGAATGTGTTGAAGTAVISVNAASAGAITATASKAGFTSGTTTVTAVPPVVVGNGTIAGRVINTSSRAAIAGATVTAGGLTATTDAAGNYTISIAAGTYTVTASATGFNTSSASVTVTSGVTTTKNFGLLRPNVAAFDTNGDGVILKAEAVAAVLAFFSDPVAVPKATAVGVVLAFFGGAP